MKEMEVFIVNLRDYTEGKESGEWFKCPVNIKEVSNRLNLGVDAEYAIHDYQLPFEIDEYIQLEELNRRCEMCLEFSEPIQMALRELTDYYGDMDELYKHAEDLFYYEGCKTPKDVAHYLVDECKCLGNISDKVKMYFDYEAYGRDLIISERVLDTGKGLFGIPR